MYAIRHKMSKKFLGVDASRVEEPNFSVDVEFRFSEFASEIPIWVVENKAQAIIALDQDTKWYNAGYETPLHYPGFNKDDYEIVELTVKY